MKKKRKKKRSGADIILDNIDRAVSKLITLRTREAQAKKEADEQLKKAILPLARAHGRKVGSGYLLEGNNYASLVYPSVEVEITSADLAKEVGAKTGLLEYLPGHYVATKKLRAILGRPSEIKKQKKAVRFLVRDGINRRRTWKARPISLKRGR